MFFARLPLDCNFDHHCHPKWFYGIFVKEMDQSNLEDVRSILNQWWRQEYIPKEDVLSGAVVRDGEHAVRARRTEADLVEGVAVPGTVAALALQVGSARRRRPSVM